MPKPNGEATGASLAVWIDHREARLIKLHEGEARVRVIESGANEAFRSFGHVGNQPPHHGYAGDKE